MGFSYVSDDRPIKPPFKVAWKTRVWSSFKGPMIVADGKVFCGGRLGPLMALDAATGEILWKTHHPGVESRPAPTYADGKFLSCASRTARGTARSSSGASGGPPGEGLWCHDAATGKVLWHQPMAFRYHFNPDGLAVHDGKVFVEQLDKDGDVEAVAFALDTGREVWAALTDLADAEDAKPNPDVKPLPKGLRLPPRFSGVIAGGLWCVSLSDRGTVALEPDTGKVVGSTRTASSPPARDRRPQRHAGRLHLDGENALDAKTGKLLWNSDNKNVYAQALSDRTWRARGRRTCTRRGGAGGRCWPTASGTATARVEQQPADRGRRGARWSGRSTSCPTPARRRRRPTGGCTTRRAGGRDLLLRLCGAVNPDRNLPVIAVLREVDAAHETCSASTTSC